MRPTHRFALYREGESPDGGTDRHATVEDYGDPVVSGVDGTIGVRSGDVEDASVGERARVRATAVLPQSELDGFRPRPGDGLEIESGDWDEPRYWQIEAVPQPGAGSWDVVVEVVADDDGF